MTLQRVAITFASFGHFANLAKVPQTKLSCNPLIKYIKAFSQSQCILPSKFTQASACFPSSYHQTISPATGITQNNTLIIITKSAIHIFSILISCILSLYISLSLSLSSHVGPPF